MPPLKPARLHPRNRHGGRYEFQKLIAASPELARFVAPNAYGDPSVDFSDPIAVRALNRALLKHFYGLEHWDLPPEFLCPPIPGRSDYVHNLADLLASDHPQGRIPRGAGVRALDIGTGASCIYPIIGNREYGWDFVGSDIAPAAIASAERIVASNAALAGRIEIRRQASPERTFEGVILQGEEFDVTLCNPPFHASPQEARAGSRRKWRNLGKGAGRDPRLNFGGQDAELWCEGGEAEFIRRMVEESSAFAARVLWFSTLVSKSESLPMISRHLARNRACETRVMEMAQGQKRSRLVAWTYLPKADRERWLARR